MLASVMPLCGALTVACGFMPTLTTAGDPRRLPTAAGADSVRIEYVCGNQFRVINYDTTASVYAYWDVAESSDTARHEWLPRSTPDLPPVSMIFTASSKGTMRLFTKDRLLGTMANGGTDCPPDFLTMLDSIMPESWRKLTDEQKGAAMLMTAALMNDPLVRFGPLGPLEGASRILHDSLVAGNEAMLDSASANLGYERLSCLSGRARKTFGSDSVSRIASAAGRAVREKHTRDEVIAGQRGIAMNQPYADEAFCLRVDSLWYARIFRLRKR